MTKKLCSHAAALVVATLSLSATNGARADALGDVKSRGELVCGVLSTAKPFGYVDAGQGRDVVGYDVDMCQAIAKGLGVKTNVKQVATDARVPELAQGRIDILTAALSWTPERAQQVDFTHQYFVARLVVATRNDSGIKTLASLNGKRVSVVKGSTSEIALRNQHPNVNVISFPDPPTAFLAFQQGKADAFSISELLMRRFLADAGASAAGFAVLPEVLQTDPWGFAVRKGEKPLLDAVNEVMRKLESSGEAKTVFERWFNEKNGYAVARSFKFEPIAK